MAGESLELEPGDEVIVLDGEVSIDRHRFQAPITLGFSTPKRLFSEQATVHLLKKNHSRGIA